MEPRIQYKLGKLWTSLDLIIQSLKLPEGSMVVKFQEEHSWFRKTGTIIWYLYPVKIEEEEKESKASSVWATAWSELYKVFGERFQQDELDLMDSVLSGVALDMQDEIE